MSGRRRHFSLGGAVISIVFFSPFRDVVLPVGLGSPPRRAASLPIAVRGQPPRDGPQNRERDTPPHPTPLRRRQGSTGAEDCVRRSRPRARRARPPPQTQPSPPETWRRRQGEGTLSDHARRTDGRGPGRERPPSHSSPADGAARPAGRPAGRPAEAGRRRRQGTVRPSPSGTASWVGRGLNCLAPALLLWENGRLQLSKFEKMLTK